MKKIQADFFLDCSLFFSLFSSFLFYSILGLLFYRIAKRTKSKNRMQITGTQRSSEYTSMFWEKWRECRLSFRFKNVVLEYWRLTRLKKAIICYSSLFVWVLKFVCLSHDITRALRYCSWPRSFGRLCQYFVKFCFVRQNL